MRENHKWTDDERNIIRRYYKHTRQSRRDVATLLGVSEYGVAGQISIMGIAKSDGRRPWSQSEKDRLAELVPQYNPRRVAKIMHRSLNSVVVMSKRLSLSWRKRTGWFTKQEVCEILGHDHKWVQVRIDNGALKASYHYDCRPSKLGGSTWHIAESDLINYIRRYPQDLVGCNVDIMMIVELLAGIINKH